MQPSTSFSWQIKVKSLTVHTYILSTIHYQVSSYILRWYLLPLNNYHDDTNFSSQIFLMSIIQNVEWAIGMVLDIFLKNVSDSVEIMLSKQHAFHISMRTSVWFPAHIQNLGLESHLSSPLWRWGDRKIPAAQLLAIPTESLLPRPMGNSISKTKVDSSWRTIPEIVF